LQTTLIQNEVNSSQNQVIEVTTNDVKVENDQLESLQSAQTEIDQKPLQVHTEAALVNNSNTKSPNLPAAIDLNFKETKNVSMAVTEAEVQGDSKDDTHSALEADPQVQLTDRPTETQTPSFVGRSEIDYVTDDVKDQPLVCTVMQ